MINVTKKNIGLLRRGSKLKNLLLIQSRVHFVNQYHPSCFQSNSFFLCGNNIFWQSQIENQFPVRLLLVALDLNNTLS